MVEVVKDSAEFCCVECRGAGYPSRAGGICAEHAWDCTMIPPVGWPEGRPYTPPRFIGEKEG